MVLEQIKQQELLFKPFERKLQAMKRREAKMKTKPQEELDEDGVLNWDWPELASLKRRCEDDIGLQPLLSSPA